MSKVEIKREDRENVEKYLFGCYKRNDNYECTNLEYAKLCLFAFGRENDADWERYRKITMGEVLDVITEMGFEKCDSKHKDCVLEGDAICFRRTIGLVTKGDEVKIEAHIMRNIVDNLVPEFEEHANGIAEACKGVGFRLIAVTESGKVVADHGQIVIHIYPKRQQEE